MSKFGSAQSGSIGDQPEGKGRADLRFCALRRRFHVEDRMGSTAELRQLTPTTRGLSPEASAGLHRGRWEANQKLLPDGSMLILHLVPIVRPIVRIEHGRGVTAKAAPRRPLEGWASKLRFVPPGSRGTHGKRTAHSHGRPLRLGPVDGLSSTWSSVLASKADSDGRGAHN